MKRVIIAGVGPCSKSCLTEEVKEAIDNSEVLIGSKRLIEEYTDKKTFYAVTAKDIIDIIDNENANNYVVLMSGDTGFYSGAKKLAEALAGKYEYSITAVTLETLNNTISLMEKNGMNVLDIARLQ